MPFEKGNKHGKVFTSSNQPKNKRGKGKLTSIAEALRAIMEEKITTKDGHKIAMSQALARKLVALAMNGNMKAHALIIDRMDGKVPDTINHNIEGELKGGAAPTVVQIVLNDEQEGQ